MEKIKIHNRSDPRKLKAPKEFCESMDHFEVKKSAYFSFELGRFGRNVETSKMAISQLFVDIFEKSQSIKSPTTPWQSFSALHFLL